MKALWIVLAWSILGAAAKADWPEFRNREFTCNVTIGNEALGKMRCEQRREGRLVTYTAEVIRDGATRWNYAGSLQCSSEPEDCNRGQGYLAFELATPLATQIAVVCYRGMTYLGSTHLRCYPPQ